MSANITCKDNICYLSGSLNFSTIMQIYQKSLTFFDQNKPLEMDFSGIHSNDSSAVALMIEWIKLAKEKKISVQFRKLPHDLRELVKTADMEKLVDGNLLNPT